MADNERSRADELFDILNEFSDDKAKNDQLNITPPTEEDVTPAEPRISDEFIAESPAESPEIVPVEETESPVSESESHVDEILEILNRGKDEAEAAFEEAPEEAPEIPMSIFSHLTEENGEDTAAAPTPIRNSHFTDHLSVDDSEPEPIPEPQPEPVSEDDEDDDENDGIVKRIFGRLAVIPKAVVYIALILIASAYLSYYIITIANDIFALVTDKREVTITIDENATHESVGELLKENGIIEYKNVYKIYMSYRSDGDSSSEYVPGDYTLNTSYNYSQIITALTANNQKREIVRVTIPEGFTIDQIIDLLVSNGIGERENYIDAINNYPYSWEFVKLLDENGYPKERKYRLEGYLYPDTYDFYTTESEVYVVNKMLAAFNDKFWKDFTRKNVKGESYQQEMLDKYKMTFDDIVVLASMVQSEGGNVNDFYAISYVFHNRLSHPSSFPKLESDATIQYALPQRISDSTQLDPSYETPYNTYLYNGLPPGAISNPGIDALYATLFPTAPQSSSGKDIDAYFFVANDAGKTYYASSKSGHENNVAQAKKDNEAIKNGTYED